MAPRAHLRCGHISKEACKGPYFKSIAEARLGRKQLSAHPWALGTRDGTMRFVPTDTGSLYLEGDGKADAKANGTSAGRQQAARDKAKPSKPISMPIRTLPTIMRELGDLVVDILKLDIEGEEVEVIPALLQVWRTWSKARWPKVVMLYRLTVYSHSAHSPTSNLQCPQCPLTA